MYIRDEDRIPEGAKRVFRGIIFDVWQWDQKMFDGTTAVFEVLNRPPTVLIIPVIGDKILLQVEQQPNRPKPFLTLPAGRCEENEDPLDSAQRELLEETGYESESWLLLKKIESLSAKIIWPTYLYVARNCVYKQAPVLDAGEKIIEKKLLSFDSFLNLSESPDFRLQEIAYMLFRARFIEREKQELYQKLFS